MHMKRGIKRKLGLVQYQGFRIVLQFTVHKDLGTTFAEENGIGICHIGVKRKCIFKTGYNKYNCKGIL